jgi:hypothetical protein
MEDVSRSIASMNAEELAALVASGLSDEIQAMKVLRNPHCTFAMATDIASRSHLASSAGVRELVCSVRGMPPGRVLDLLATLPWLSLMNLAQNPRTPPRVKRQAEIRLIHRIEKLTVGERIAAARRAHRALVPHLMKLGELQVIRAMLDNPRLTGDDIVRLLQASEVPQDLFPELVRHPRWGPRPEIRFAIARGKGVPIPLALSAIAQMPLTDLATLAADPTVQNEIRIAARRLQQRRSRRRSGPVQDDGIILKE